MLPDSGVVLLREDGMAAKLTKYSDFWPYYLREHAKPQTRAIHYIGTALVFAALALALITGNYWWLLGMPLAGYAFAWIGHFFIEKNRPATFTYPFWSLISDFRMFGHFVTGTMRRELEKHQIRTA
jgi:hypothetical protein